jgi:hypothetical protein
VPLIDERTGLIAREWYRFFLNLFNLAGGGSNTTSLTDLQLGPPTPQQEDLVDIVIDVEATKIQPTEESANEQIAELQKQVEALAVMPLTSWVLSELAELQAQIDGLLAASIPPVNFLTNGASILYGDNLGGFSNVAIGSGISFSGGTLSATGSGGTVTAVTGTAPVVSSGGTTPAISMPKATGSVDGYLSSTDWTTFNSKQPAGTYVTSVGGTAPITSSGGTTPTIGVTAAALTKTDDTNVTLTLGGSPTTALLAATSLTLGWTGQLSAARGGTGTGTYAVGDILYADTTSTLAKLADVATGNALISGGIGVAPSYGKIGLTTHVSGVLPTANGGTNLSSFTANGIVYASSISALATGSALTFDGTNFSTTGTASATKLIPTGGTATGNGMYLPAANELAISTAGLQRVYLTSNGNMRLNSTANAGSNGTGLAIYASDFPRMTLRNSTTGDTTGDGFQMYMVGNDVYHNLVESGFQAWFTSNAERMRITSVGNLKIGGTADRATTEGTNQLVLFNGTAPVGTLTNGVSFYSAAGEARVMDAAGNSTLLSPHDQATNEWIFHSKHTPSGKVLRIDVEKMLRFINDHFGLDMIQEFTEE